MGLLATKPARLAKAVDEKVKVTKPSPEVEAGYLVCKVCGRRLKNEESRRTGMGPVCAKRYKELPGRRKLF